MQLPRVRYLNPGPASSACAPVGSDHSPISAYEAVGRYAMPRDRRDASLLVYHMGGNELGYPSLKRGEGELYADAFRKSLARVSDNWILVDLLLLHPVVKLEEHGLDKGLRSCTAPG